MFSCSCKILPKISIRLLSSCNMMDSYSRDIGVSALLNLSQFPEHLTDGLTNGLSADQSDPAIRAGDQTVETDTTTQIHPVEQALDHREYSAKDSFICSYSCCGKSFQSAYHLKIHTRTHTNERPYICMICEKSFSTNYALTTHMRVHTGERPFQCTFVLQASLEGQERMCMKAFKTSGDLQKHMRTHTGYRPFVCSYDGCGLTFTTGNILKVHERTHTGERPFVCAEKNCGKRFTSAANYRNHVRIHTGDKPYVCGEPGCNKRFTEYSSLYKHQVVHLHIKPYTCASCGKSYRNQYKFSDKIFHYRRLLHSRPFE